MQRWTKILPFFLVVWIARRELERLPVPGHKTRYVSPYPGVLISVLESRADA